MGNRILKINAEIQKIVGTIIKDLNNPVIENSIVCVTDVKTTEDLDISKIYISVFDKDNNVVIPEFYSEEDNYEYKEVSKNLDIDKIISYVSNFESETPHFIKANYIKKIEVEK